jgi:hypothetical protein
MRYRTATGIFCNSFLSNLLILGANNPTGEPCGYTEPGPSHLTTDFLKPALLVGGIPQMQQRLLVDLPTKGQLLGQSNDQGLERLW